MKATASKVHGTRSRLNEYFVHSTSIVLVCLLWVLFAGCKNESKVDPPEQQGTNILFYPLSNTYYDVDRDQYYKYDSLARTWQPKKELTPAENSGLGRSVLLEKVSDPVYTDNEQHKLVYGPLLYSSPEEIREKYEQDSLAHEVDSLANAPRPDSMDRVEERPRSKFGKFLRKVFGKRDQSE